MINRTSGRGNPWAWCGFARLVSLVVLLALTVLVPAQPCADCTIGIPVMEGNGPASQPTEFLFPMTGMAWNCNDRASSPQWSVSGQAVIDGPASDSVVRVLAEGPFGLHLAYWNATSGQSATCTMQAGVRVQPNPPLSVACSLNLILVLDESNSISNSQENLVRQAVIGLLESLSGSGAHVAIVEFGTRAEAEMLQGCGAVGNPHYVEVTDETVNGCLWDYLATDYGITPSGGTNWDDAFLKVKQVIDGNLLQPDLILFITDGNPTFYMEDNAGNALGGSGIQTAVSAVMHAVGQANIVKETAPVFAVGIGNSVTSGNLAMISGTRPFTDDLAAADFISLNNFQELSTNLQQLSVAICAPLLHLSQSQAGCATAPDYRFQISWELENTGAVGAAGTELAITPPPGYLLDSMRRIPEIGTIRNSGDQWIWDVGPIETGQQVHWAWSGRLGGTEDALFSASATAQGLPEPLQLNSGVTISSLSVEIDVLAEACGDRPNGMLQLMASGGTPPYRITWSTGDTAHVLTGLPSGNYHASVSDAVGCAVGLSAVLGQAIQVPMFVPLEASATELCPSSQVVLSGPAGFNTYQWFLNGEPIGQTADPQWVAGEPGAYTLFLEEEALCVAGMSEPLIIGQAVPQWESDTLYLAYEAVFGEGGLPLCPDGIPGSLPLNPDSYEVFQVSGGSDFTLDTSLQCLVPSSDPPAWQSDTLVLLVCDTIQCANCSRHVWIVSKAWDAVPPGEPAAGQCLVPQVITPNGDGLNDVFVVSCTGEVSGPSVQVFNRWGNEVYRNMDYRNDWSGTYRGSPLPSGTYYYSIVTGPPNGEFYRTAGFLTIIR